MVKFSFRTKSVTTKVTAEQHAQLESLAVACGQNMSEWVRDALLNQARSADEILLAEVLAMRTILLNLLYHSNAGDRLNDQQMRELIEQADQTKMKKANERLNQALRGEK